MDCEEKRTLLDHYPSKRARSANETVRDKSSLDHDLLRKVPGCTECKCAICEGKALALRVYTVLGLSVRGPEVQRMQGLSNSALLSEVATSGLTQIWRSETELC